MIETVLQIPVLSYGSFALACMLLAITPGADFMLVASTGVNAGPRVGRAAALGTNLGVITHILMAVLGVSALLIASPAAFDILGYAGAAYLILMAVRAWQDDGTIKTGQGALNRAAAFKRGYLTNVLNPKTALFIFAFIPQFANPAFGPIWHQIIIFGLVFIMVGLPFMITLATLAGHLGPYLQDKIRLLNKLTAILFGGLAAKLVFE